MIIDGIITTIFYIIGNILTTILPPATWLPDNIANGWDWLNTWIAKFAYVIPTGTNLLLVLGFMSSILGTVFLFKSFNWVWNKIRGSGN